MTACVLLSRALKRLLPKIKKKTQRLLFHESCTSYLYCFEKKRVIQADNQVAVLQNLNIVTFEGHTLQGHFNFWKSEITGITSQGGLKL